MSDTPKGVKRVSPTTNGGIVIRGAEMGKSVRTYRIGKDEEALVRAAARREDLPPSTFVRRAAVERAASVVSGGDDWPEEASGEASRKRTS